MGELLKECRIGLTRDLIHGSQKEVSVKSLKAKLVVNIHVPLGRRAVIEGVSSDTPYDDMWSQIDQGTPTRYFVMRRSWERRERRIGA